MKIYIETNNSIIRFLIALFLKENLPEGLHVVAEWALVILTFLSLILPTIVKVIMIIKDPMMNFIRKKLLNTTEASEMKKNEDIIQ
jgi:hypothetical protein